MSHDDCYEVVREHQFKDGLAFLPVIVSLSNPNKHLHILPHGVYAFYFDRERRLVTWKPWADAGTNSFGYTNGGLRATLSTTTNK